MDSLITKEKEKYDKMWAIDSYSKYSPAMVYKDAIIKFCKQNDIKLILDAGCGSGDLMNALFDNGFLCKGVDITKKGIVNYGDCGVIDCNNFIESPLHNFIFEELFDLIICCDVLEHIPKELIELSLKNLSNHCIQYGKAFFDISLSAFDMGNLINEKLHVSVLQPEQWHNHISKYFKIEKEIIDKTRYTAFCEK